MIIYVLTHEIKEKYQTPTTYDIVCAYEMQEDAVEALIATACQIASGTSPHFQNITPKRIPFSPHCGFGLLYEWENDGREFQTIFKIKEVELN